MSPYTQQQQQQGPPQQVNGPPHMQGNQQNAGGGGGQAQQQQQQQQAGPQPQHAGMHPGMAGQPGVIPPQGIPQQYPHPLQYPATMYPHMQVLPANLPGNVFVSNVTANVNVHGWHTSIPQFPVPAYAPTQEVPVAQSPGHDSQVSVKRLQRGHEYKYPQDCQQNEPNVRLIRRYTCGKLFDCYSCLI